MLAAFTWMPDGSPANVRWRDSVGTPEALLAAMDCQDVGTVPLPFVANAVDGGAVMLHNVRPCPPTAALVRFAAERIPASAVFAIDKVGGFAAPVFLPQQVVAWPGWSGAFLNEERLFEPYFRQYRSRVARYGAQPFFNDRESRAERLEFIEALGVTHVLVEPQNHVMMTRVLGGLPAMFRPVFDENGWAVYVVLDRGSGTVASAFPLR